MTEGTDDNLALVPVMNYYASQLAKLCKATGEGPDQEFWDELRIYMPPATREVE